VAARAPLTESAPAGPQPAGEDHAVTADVRSGCSAGPIGVGPGLAGDPGQRRIRRAALARI